MQDLIEMWQRLNQTKQMMLVGGLLAIVILIVILSTWIMSPTYQTLFSDLDAKSGKLVIEELKKKGIAYQISSDGKNIQVPDSQLHETRLDLMGSEIPANVGLGFELFDNTDFGMTEFAQQINYQRALQGELTRTIMALDAVRYACVHLVLPKHSLFTQQQARTSASVTVFLNKQQQLSNTQILGIQKLVASAVPKLEYTDVTISDEQGHTLSIHQPVDAMESQMSMRLSKKKSIEYYLTSKIDKVIEMAFGTHNALVTVDVSLNMDTQQSTIEDVLAPNQVNKAILKKKVINNSQGSLSNVNNKQSRTTEVEYVFGKKTQHVVKKPGDIARISIAVLVSQDTSDEIISKLEDLVAMTAGIDRRRGDAVAIHAIPNQALTRLDAPISHEQKTQPSTLVGQPTINEPIDQEQRVLFGLIGLGVLMAAAWLLLKLAGRRGQKAPSSSHSRQAFGLNQRERNEVADLFDQWISQAPNVKPFAEAS